MKDVNVRHVCYIAGKIHFTLWLIELVTLLKRTHIPSIRLVEKTILKVQTQSSTE